ncbi:MAG: GNAT family N-acetyltransferase [Peptoniphilus sp.]|nr:GNAT family N-acetyltransferase [Peptoniphilus sp.]MDD7363730.1 GNAT family N-acetyltransferase [Bacillota bacterium]MDY6044115.1 GNAT family N-acetyltransferase [Peptoniphilus sp.]
MDIKLGNNRFYIGEDQNKPDAFISWVPSGEDKIIIDHTIVNPALEGQGIAGKLLDKVTDYARENNLKILATCGFAVNRMKDNEEYSDVYMG